MKASALIEALQQAITEHGDRDVFVYIPDETYAAAKDVYRFQIGPTLCDDPYQVGDFYIS